MGLEAKITWLDGNIQYITYMYNGNISFYNIESIVINEDMSELGILFDNGIVLATSQHIYEKINGV